MITSNTQMNDAVLHITLDRPKANILDAEMITAIQDALANEVKDSTRLIVFEGAGEHFSFGASVEEHQAEQAKDMLDAFHGLFRKLAELGVPTCAVVRGQCLGGGLELASWCSWIVATPEARLGQPEIKLAVFAPIASVLLPWRCGGRAALDLCISGRTITADEGVALGLINAVTPEPEQWWQMLVEKKLSMTSAQSLRFAEKAARMNLMQQLEDYLPKLEQLYVDDLMKTHDANEGIAAFLERRKPAFQDR
jgi:cyclohexa-1,5-dienecarbonyl-CoA hydratase